MSNGDDLSEARALLDGYLEEDAKGKLRLKYLKPGSEKERSARQALARVLRGNAPLEPQLRDSLASLLDPDPPEWQQRKIIIKARRPGGLTDHDRNTQIAYHIRDEVERGETVTAAIASAAENFAISPDMVTKIWSGYRPLLERIHGPLRRGRVKA